MNIYIYTYIYVYIYIYILYTGRSNACLSVVGRVITIYSFKLNISPKMSYGVLEYDIVMLQNYGVMVL